LLVPPNTTKEQLKDFIYKIRQGKKDKTLSKFLPPVNLRLPDKYTNFIVLIFSDPKWATIEEYNKYEKADMKSNVAQTYLNHVSMTVQTTCLHHIGTIVMTGNMVPSDIVMVS
jgi:hypothetical protein